MVVRELERLSEQLAEKQYTGLFYAEGTGGADVKTCLKDYLDKQIANKELRNAFPFLLSNCIEGDIKGKNYTICHFNVDYDVIAGLHIAKMSAVQQRDHETKTLNTIESETPVTGIPDKSEVLAMFTQREYLTVTPPKITMDQIEKFVAAVSAKGYTGPFYGANLEPTDLKSLLVERLKDNLSDNELNVRPFWVGTVTDGRLSSKEQTVVMMNLNPHQQDGINLERIKYTRTDLHEGALKNVKELRTYTTKGLPSKKFINELALKSVEKENKRRGKRL